MSDRSITSTGFTVGTRLVSAASAELTIRDIFVGKNTDNGKWSVVITVLFRLQNRDEYQDQVLRGEMCRLIDKGEFRIVDDPPVAHGDSAPLPARDSGSATSGFVIGSRLGGPDAADVTIESIFVGKSTADRKWDTFITTAVQLPNGKQSQEHKTLAEIAAAIDNGTLTIPGGQLQRPAAHNSTSQGTETTPRKAGKSGDTPGELSMDRNAFWSIIDRARRSVGSADEIEAVAAAVTEHLKRFTPAEILSFEQHRCDLLAESYRWDLWAVAYVVNGGCSDDGFDYFRGWLLANGRMRWEAAMKNPEEVGKWAQPDEAFCEEMLYVASDAYAAVTGNELPQDAIIVRSPASPAGERFEEDALPDRYPELCRKFGG